MPSNILQNAFSESPQENNLHCSSGQSTVGTQLDRPKCLKVVE